MRKLHNQLQNNFNWYNRYHQWQHHHTIHWTVLVIYVLSVVSFGWTSVYEVPKARATDPEISAAKISGEMPLSATMVGPTSEILIREAVYDFSSSRNVTSYQVDYSCSASGPFTPWNLFISDDIGNFGSAVANMGCTSTGTASGSISKSGRYAMWRVQAGAPFGTSIITLSNPHLYGTASDPPPTISIGSPSNNCAGGKHYTRSSSVTVSGTASDTSPGTVSSVTVNGGSATGTTSWSKSGVSLPSEGNNTITAIATDNSAQTGSASMTVYKDTTAPTVTISSPSEGTVTSSSTATISGSASDNSGGSGLTSVTSSTGSSVSGASSWSTTVNLSAGSNTITITATDCAGNTGTQSVGIVYQNGGGGNPDPDMVKSITVTAPNGGENYLTGVGSGALSSTAITWTTKNISSSEKIKLSYTTDNSTYSVIADNEGNDGSYSWTLPSAKSTLVKVKAELTSDASVADTSDNTFTLHSNSAPVLSL